MKRILIILGLVAASLVLIVAVGLGILLYVIDPNDYKKEISQMARNAIGRELVFEEDISVSVFPRLSLKTGKLSLSDARGFSGGAFLRVKSAEFRLEVLPLIFGAVEIDEAALDGVRLKLEVDSRGRKNWESLKAEKSAGGNEAAPAEKTGQGAPGADGGSFSGAASNLADASAKPSDKGSGSGMSLSVERIMITDCEISYADLAKGGSYILELSSLRADGLAPGAEAILQGAATARDLAAGMAVHMNVDGAVRLANNFAVQKADISSLGLILDVNGQKGLASLDLELDFSASEQKLNISIRSGKLGTADLKGALTALLPGAKDLAKDLRLDVRGNLEMGSLDVDALMARLGQGKDAQSPETEDDSGKTGRKEGRPGEDPFATLAGIYAELDFSAKEAIFSGHSGTNIKASIKADRGVIDVSRYAFNIFGGQASGQARADLARKIPSLRLAGVATGMRVGDVFKDGAGKALLRGSFSGNVDVSGNGLDWKEIAPSLNGKGDFLVTGGEVKNMVFTAGSIIPGFDVKLPSDFRLDKLSGNYTITNGVVANNDLTLLSPVLKATGGGTVDLPAQSLDFAADVALPGMGYFLPVYARGKFLKLSYGVDSKKLMKNLVKNRASGVLKNFKDLGDSLKNMF